MVAFFTGLIPAFLIFLVTKSLLYAFIGYWVCYLVASLPLDRWIDDHWRKTKAID